MNYFFYELPRRCSLFAKIGMTTEWRLCWGYRGSNHYGFIFSNWGDFYFDMSFIVFCIFCIFCKLLYLVLIICLFLYVYCYCIIASFRQLVLFWIGSLKWRLCGSQPFKPNCLWGTLTKWVDLARSTVVNFPSPGCPLGSPVHSKLTQLLVN